VPSPFAQGYGAFVPGSGQREGFPGIGGREVGSLSGLRLARDATDDAYNLTIELGGMSPDEIQVLAQGQWLVIKRGHTEQQVQKESFDDGRGYMRSFSYSSGTASRRLSIPRDGDLSAMSREDGKGTVRISIPRRGR
jgi:HSP20 family molecular chaperone IbpA